MAVRCGFDEHLKRFSSRSTISGDVMEVITERLANASKGLTAALLATIPRAPRDRRMQPPPSCSDGASDVAAVASNDNSRSGALQRAVEDGDDTDLDDTDATFAVLRVERASASGVGAPNMFFLVVGGDWKEGCSFIAVGDELSLCCFDMLPSELADDIVGIGTLTAAALLVTPNYSSEITLVRKKKVVINSKNAGQLEELEFSDRHRREALRLRRALGLGVTAPAEVTLDVPAPTDRNTFARMHRYADVVFGQRSDFNRRYEFITQRISCGGGDASVLDVGCGTGLLSFALRNAAIFPVLVDISPRAAELVSEKNRFVAEVEDARSATRGRQLQFYTADVRNFALHSTSPDGREEYANFSTVLCLDTLALLESADDVLRALHNLHLHTAMGGTAIVSFPNRDARIRDHMTQSARQLPIDKHQLCIGASAGLGHGQLDLVVRTRVLEANAAAGGLLRAFHNVSDDDENDEEGGGAAMRASGVGPSAAEDEDELLGGLEEGESMGRDGVPRIQSTYIGAALHRHGPTKKLTFADFTDSTTELLLSGGLLDTLVLTAGFDIDELYGDDGGSEYNQNSSTHRVYILRKRAAI